MTDELREITEHLLRFSPDALIVVDDGARIRFANETVRELFGYAPDTLIGKPIDALIPTRLRAHHGKHTAGYVSSPNNREMGARIADLLARRSDGTEFPAGIKAPVTACRFLSKPVDTVALLQAIDELSATSRG